MVQDKSKHNDTQQQTATVTPEEIKIAAEWSKESWKRDNEWLSKIAPELQKEKALSKGVMGDVQLGDISQAEANKRIAQIKAPSEKMIKQEMADLDSIPHAATAKKILKEEFMALLPELHAKGYDQAYLNSVVKEIDSKGGRDLYLYDLDGKGKLTVESVTAIMAPPSLPAQAKPKQTNRS